MRPILVLLLSIVLSAVPSTISADRSRTVTPGGYQAGLTKLLRVAPSVPLWGPGIETPVPGGEMNAILNSPDESGHRTPDVAKEGNDHPQSMQSVPPNKAMKSTVTSPGGYQAGLTKLLRVNTHVPVWGPGIKTPPPGGEILAPVPRQRRQR